MSIITKILNWIRQILGTTNITVVVEPCKVEAPVVEKEAPEDTAWPFPTGTVPVEGMGVISVVKTKPAAMSAKPKAAAKPKVSKPKVLKPKAAPKTKTAKS
tara:strand:- start:1013 stop:1315 length:303 start_codon:yes stop_codon:yes gene_type:complete